MLANRQVDAPHEGGINLPATGRQDLLDNRLRAEYHSMSDLNQASAPHGLDHLGIEQLGQRHPTRLGLRTFRLAPRWLHPMAKVGQDGGAIVL